jgi:dihydrofolate synthase / folylpolyglutamate synthase
LTALGHPERALPPVIHVAGTNGKGSVVANLRAMFEAAGLKAHVYISPHLVRFHERIRINGRLISEHALDEALRACETANRGQPITFFEITTAAAFLTFAHARADVTLLEVGLGGRLDATNVVVPRVSVITPVARDHQQFLGTTLSKIAHEKAGIVKSGVPCITGPQHAHAAAVIKARTKKLGAPLIRFGEEFKGRLGADGALHFRDQTGSLTLPPPALQGAHQIANTLTAVAAARAFDDPRLDAAAMERGLTQVHWPARLQRLGDGRLTGTLSAKGFDVWLDGGHNPHAGRALAKVIANWRAETRAPVYLICGMLTAKDPAGFLAPLTRHATACWTVPVPDHAGFDPRVLADRIRRLGLTVTATEGLETAFAALQRRRPGRVLVTGSLYLAGALLAADGFRPR